MAVDVVIPSMGESVTTATISRWKKKVGDVVKVDEALVEVDSDKASVEVPSPVAGRIVEILAGEGAEVAIGQAIVRVEEGAVAESAPTAASPVAAASSDSGKPAPSSPSVRSAAREAGVDVATVAGSGPGGRVTKADVSAAAQKPVASAPVPVKAAPVVSAPVFVGEDLEEIVPMTTLRKRIAERLVQAQSTAAILTTFNEVDMSAIMELRERYQDRFTKKYGVKLGFMSFFVKASIDALKAIPGANAEIRGNDIVYKHYYHMGVAVSGARGLVVPVLRNADQLNFAETEIAIAKFGQKARDNQLSIDEMQGGTFTLSNGGIFGSMMSTPILNPPQVAILGMHAIQKRAVVVNDEIVIRPMMYLAVSYDHRLLDGREAVTFLVRIKECLEAPERMLLEI